MSLSLCVVVERRHVTLKSQSSRETTCDFEITSDFEIKVVERRL